MRIQIATKSTLSVFISLQLLATKVQIVYFLPIIGVYFLSSSECKCIILRPTFCIFLQIIDELYLFQVC